MTQHPPIAIPLNLLPSDGRFGSGPSRIDPASLVALGATGPDLVGTSHRRPGVKSLVGSLRSSLSVLHSLPDGYEVVLGVGGATAFWDAAAFGLVEARSAHFICGEFSSKFAAVTAGAPHLEDPVVISADYGDAPEPRPVEGVDVAAFIHNETSTGVLAPFSRIGDELVLVDGTSAAGAIPFDPSSVDAYYFSPQKALASEGGLWFAFMSPAAIERVETITSRGRWIPQFLSLKTAIENSAKDQTYNTPSISTLFLMARQVDSILGEGGLPAAAKRSAASSNHLYSWADESEFASPFVRRPELRSPTVVTIDFTESVDADTVAAVLRSNGIVDTESYRKLGRNQLRIATFPSIPTDDVESLTSCIDYVVGALPHR
jgi:phosphoserine aminotransferase